MPAKTNPGLQQTPSSLPSRIQFPGNNSTEFCGLYYHLIMFLCPADKSQREAHWLLSQSGGSGNTQAGVDGAPTVKPVPVILGEAARCLEGRSLGTGTIPPHKQVMGWQPTAQVPQVMHSWTALAALMKQGRSTHHAVWTRCWLRSHSNTWRYITIIWKIWVRQLLPKTTRARNSDLGVHAAKEPQAKPQGAPGDVQQTAQLLWCACYLLLYLGRVHMWKPRYTL